MAFLIFLPLRFDANKKDRAVTFAQSHCCRVYLSAPSVYATWRTFAASVCLAFYIKAVGKRETVFALLHLTIALHHECSLPCRATASG